MVDSQEADVLLLTDGRQENYSSPVLFLSASSKRNNFVQERF